MIPTLIISLITFVSVTLSILLFPKIKIGKLNVSTYWLIALIGAIIFLICNFAPIRDVWNQLTSNDEINPLKIIVLFFSMTILSIYLDEAGLFKYLANLATKRAKNNQFILFTALYFLVAVLTVFTSNDIVILTFTPFICFFCKNAKINPIPYLVAEFTAANTWSLMLIIGNPTNIYLATSAGIDFFEYFKVMAIPTLVAGTLEYLVLLLLFFKKLKLKLDVEYKESKIQNKPALIIGISHLLICLVFLVISSYLSIEMWLISLICAVSLLVAAVILCLITKKNWSYITNSLKKLPYQLIPFFLSMFVIVVALTKQGVSTEIEKLFSSTNHIWSYGISSFFACNLINNIPMSILFSSICGDKAAVFASIVGSNIGAFLTPIGALAGIMFTDLVNKHEAKYSFLDFVKYGSIVSVPILAVTLLMLSITF